MGEPQQSGMKVFLEYLATVMGVLMSLGHFPQAYRMFKNRSSRDVSLLAYVIFATGGLTWFLYGLAIDSRAITISYAPGVLGAWLALSLILIYRKRKNLDPRDSKATDGIKLGRYRHFKGKEYEVICVARHSETLEEFVVYKALYDGEYGYGACWLRPKAMFLETVERDGKTFLRFEYLGPLQK